MSTIRFIGRILPASYHLTLALPIAVEWKDNDVEYVIKLKVTIKDNVIVADCDVNNYERTTHIPRLLLRAIDTSQAAVDVVAFSLGAPLSVIFETFAEPGGENLQLHVRDSDLAALVTAFSLDTPEFQKILQIVLEEPNLFHALRDLIDATSAAYKVVPHCAKAIETLRALLTPPGADRKQGWSIMCKNLQVGKDYLKLITDQSKAPRHGDHQAILGTMTEEVSRRSWIVMNRFLEFRKRGNQPLPLDQFPLLSG